MYVDFIYFFWGIMFVAQCFRYGIHDAKSIVRIIFIIILYLLVQLFRLWYVKKKHLINHYQNSSIDITINEDGITNSDNRASCVFRWEDLYRVYEPSKYFYFMVNKKKVLWFQNNY